MSDYLYPRDVVWTSKVVAATGTGVAIVAVQTWARALWIVAAKVTGANTGAVYIGDSTVDKTSLQYLSLSPGDYWEMPIPEGTKVDLNTLYVDAATNGDSILIGYIQA